MIPPQCAICIRNINNYKGNFMLLEFKKNPNEPELPVNWVGPQPNTKWCCAIHYPLLYNYKNMMWIEARKKLKEDNNISKFYG